jgi:hypothetical protein
MRCRLRRSKRSQHDDVLVTSEKWWDTFCKSTNHNIAWNCGNLHTSWERDANGTKKRNKRMNEEAERFFFSYFGALNIFFFYSLYNFCELLAFLISVHRAKLKWWNGCGHQQKLHTIVAGNGREKQNNAQFRFFSFNCHLCSCCCRSLFSAL